MKSKVDDVDEEDEEGDELYDMKHCDGSICLTFLQCVFSDRFSKQFKNIFKIRRKLDGDEEEEEDEVSGRK